MTIVVPKADAFADAGQKKYAVTRNLADFARVLSPQPPGSRSLFERLMGRSASTSVSVGGNHVVS